MRVLLDANVLYPTVMREVLLAVAGQGLFSPLWSDRIIEEWARAAAKLGPDGEALARGDIALLRPRWPEACVGQSPDLEVQLWLPDPNDVHVLASAIAGQAEILCTMNAKDFPRQELAPYGLIRLHPDELMISLFADHPSAVSGAAEAVRAKAEELSGTAQPLRPLLKKARLPRLGKAVSGSTF